MSISRFFRHSQYTISIGFVLVLILMAAIAVIVLTRMAVMLFAEPRPISAATIAR